MAIINSPRALETTQTVQTTTVTTITLMKDTAVSSL